MSAYLKRKGWVSPGEPLQVSALPGGVSNHVWSVASPRGRWVLKQPLPKLATDIDWVADVRRIQREEATMRLLGAMLPAGAVPEVVFADAEQNVCVMTSAPPGAQSWKERLMDGVFEPFVAHAAGLLLRRIQEGSQSVDARTRRSFMDLSFFEQLRLDPFHRFLARRYPALQGSICRLVEELQSRQECLVHGDFSPKNMLIDRRGVIVLLDFEVAHWGCALYDVSYCLGHLMLKGWVLGREAQALGMIQEFLRGYGRAVAGLVPHLGLMLLARLDGKSPMPYLQGDALRARIREVAIDWIRRPTGEEPLELIRQAWQPR